MGAAAAGIRIRVAEAADVGSVVRIYVDSWNAGFAGLMPPRALTVELVARWRDEFGTTGRGQWWVAEIRGSVVGFAGVCPSRDPTDPALGELDTIAVAPCWWRAGAGRALMEAALQHLAIKGYQEAVLWTLADYPRGRWFYEAMGWRADGGVRDNGRQIRYRLRLDRSLHRCTAADERKMSAPAR